MMNEPTESEKPVLITCNNDPIYGQRKILDSHGNSANGLYKY